MKKIHILSVLVLVASLYSCKSKTSVTKVETGEVSIRIRYTEQHCGGSEPSEIELSKLFEPKPYALQDVYISQQTGPFTFSQEVVARTDKAGIITLKLDSGFYAISMHSLATIGSKFEEGGKVKNPDPNNTEDPNEGDVSMTPEQEKAECEAEWKRMSAAPIKISGGKTAYEIIMHKECNPCEEPRP
jgi:hypothetical protein